MHRDDILLDSSRVGYAEQDHDGTSRNETFDASQARPYWSRQMPEDR